MTCRSVSPVRLLVLALLPCLGCATFSVEAPLAALSGKQGSPGGHKEQTLPPTEAAEVCLGVARSLEQNGHELEAAGQYELARQYNPQADVSRRLAVLYDRQGDVTRARLEYQRALEAHPKDADILNDLGYHYYNQGKWVDAEQYLRKALEIDPRHHAAWTNLGMTLAQQGRYPESLEAFQHSVSAGEAQCNLAFLLMTQGKREEARAAYREALRLQPELRLARAALDRLENPKPHTTAAAPPRAETNKQEAEKTAPTEAHVPAQTAPAAPADTPGPAAEQASVPTPPSP